MKALREQLIAGRALVAPGVFDGLSATLVERAGFPLAFLSGSAVSCAQLARPDVGLITLHDVASALDKICDRVRIPIMVDVDSGFGNAINVARTIRTLERAGAAGIQIEDQIATKNPADVMSRPLISTQEMVDKIKSAQDAKRHATTLVSARCDAVYTEGVAAAMERAHCYVEAGADLLFIEGVGDRNDLQAIGDEFREKIPLLYNAECDKCVEPFTIKELNDVGMSVVLYPGVILREMAKAGGAALDALQVAVVNDLGGNKAVTKSHGLADILQSKEFLDQYRS